MSEQIELNISGARSVLRGDGTVFLPASETLLVADLHLGKEHAFRAGGIPVPEGPSAATLNDLSLAIAATHCRQLIVLGDLIHNRDSMTMGLIEQVGQWKQCHQTLQFRLIRGNHDRHVSHFPDSWQLSDCECWELEGLTLVHEAPTQPDESRYYLEGHLHPVVAVGRGADRMRVRCFVQREDRLTLPAFGPFKGGGQVSNRGAKLFPIVGGQVLHGRPGTPGDTKIQNH